MSKQVTSNPQIRRQIRFLGVCTGLLAILTFSDFAQAQDNNSSSLNAYDHARSEQLIDAGRRAMEAGEFAEAERVFLEAVQIAKANFGLDSPRQRIPLESAIAAQLAQGKWKQVDNHLGYFEWLNKETYKSNFYAYLRGTEQLYQMLLKASADSDNPLGFRYLIAAKNLNWRAVAGIEATLGESHPELVPWLYNIVLAHYYQSSLIRRYGMVSTVIRNEQNEEVSGWTLTKGESLRISYRIGKELLERIVTIHEQAPEPNSESAALAHVYIADWELMFGNEEAALTAYREAFDRLLAAGADAEQVNQVFARPSILPDQKMHASIDSMLAETADGPVQFNAWSTNYPAAALPSEHVAINGSASSEIMALLRFDLHPLLPSELLSSRRSIQLGFNLEDLEIVSTTPDSDLIRERAMYEVSLLQFRPQLVNGFPQRTENIELQYLFPPKYISMSDSNNTQ